MSEVRKIANKAFESCVKYPGDVEGRNWLFGFLACAVVLGEISEKEVEAALKRL